DAAKPAAVAEAEAVVPVVSGKVAPKADAVSPPVAAEADIAALPRNDPRWTGEAKPAATVDTAAATGSKDETLTAFAEENAKAVGATVAEASSSADDVHAEPDPKAATAA